MNFSGYDHSPRRGAGALILNREEEVLLLLRRSTSRIDAGLWSQPGGAMDEGDVTPQAAVEREVLEELGLSVRIRRFLTTTYHGEAADRWFAYSYLARPVAGRPELLEPTKHAAMRWFPLGDLPPNINQVTAEAVLAYRALHEKRSSTALVIFDMDGTLLPDTTANIELARVLGSERLVHELEAEYHAGAIDNRTYASRILDLYARLSDQLIEEAFHRAPKLPGLLDLVGWAATQGASVAVLTTGPEFFARRFAEHYRFEHVIGGSFPLHGESLDLSSCDVVRDGDKPMRARMLCKILGVPESRCVVVGDSRSDVALFAEFQNSIALNHHQVLNGKARYYLQTQFAPDLIPAIAHLLR